MIACSMPNEQASSCWQLFLHAVWCLLHAGCITQTHDAEMGHTLQCQSHLLDDRPYQTFCMTNHLTNVPMTPLYDNLLTAVQEQSLVDIAMPGQYMNGEEPSQEGIVFLEGISANVHVSDMTPSSLR